MSDRRLHRIFDFDYIPGQRRRRPARWGVIALVVTAVVVVLGVSHWSPFTSYSMRARAQFGYALHVYPHTPVRIDGFDVGSVSGSSLQPNSSVTLTMTITNRQVHLYRNASAQLYYRTLLGRNLYVALDPGTPSAGPLAGATIPESRTGAQVEVDQALSPLQPTARRGVQQTISELGTGLDDGNAPREVIDRAGSALTNTGVAAQAVRGQNPGYDLPQLELGGDATIRALNADENALVGLLDNGNTTLAVTAARQAALGSILDQGPSTLASTEQTMVRLRGTLAAIDPLAERLLPGVEGIRPAVAEATPTMREITAIVPPALPAFRELDPTLSSLGTLSDQGLPLISGLDPTLARTNGQIIPWLSEVSPVSHLKNYETIGPTIAAVSSSSSTYDAGGFQQRFQPGQKTGFTQLPFGSSQCASLLPASVSGAAAACEQLVGDLNAVFSAESGSGTSSASGTGAAR